jgi:cytoskeletal protein CcmA (bactofilin family)
MARERASNGSPPESVISIIGPGMSVVGDCHTEGTIRVEGTVRGSVWAGKAVVVGREGLVEGDITTQDAVISGSVHGALVAESRLELQATCRIEGDVRARRMQLEEGAVLNGTVQMGEVHTGDGNGVAKSRGMTSDAPSEVVAQATGSPA